LIFLIPDDHAPKQLHGRFVGERAIAVIQSWLDNASTSRCVRTIGL
jgi:hypothetical protein